MQLESPRETTLRRIFAGGRTLATSGKFGFAKPFSLPGEAEISRPSANWDRHC